MGGGSDGIKETSAEKTQADIAMQRFRDYQANFAQYEDQFIDEVGAINGEARYQRATELAINPIASEFAEQGALMTRNLNAQGVNPNSGMATMARVRFNDAQASAETDVSSRATSSQQDNYVQGLKNVAAIGQGQAADAMQGLSSVASTSSAYARSKAQDAAQDRSNVNQAAGLAIGGATSYGLNKTTEGTGA